MSGGFVGPKKYECAFTNEKMKCKMSSSLSHIPFWVRQNKNSGIQAKALLNYAGAHLLFYTHTHTPETKKFQNHNFQNSKCARKRIMHVPCINLKWKMENGKWKKAKCMMA